VTPVIRRLTGSATERADLAHLLAETVNSGGSVWFLAPLTLEKAAAFWDQSFAAAKAGERIILGALADGQVVATVTLQLAGPENQAHRGEIAKMMTLPAWRGRGLASALLAAAEAEALAHGKWLLVLDTAADGGAAGLYARHAYIKAGEIPDYALTPQGRLSASIYFYKRLTPAA